MKRRWLVLTSAVVVVFSSHCSRPDATSSAGPAAPSTGAPAASAGAELVIHSEDQVCDLLTPEEVTAVIHQPTSAKRLPKAGEYGAPECGWFASDAPTAPGVSVVLFFHPDTGHGKQLFADKLKSVCRGELQEVPSLGDEAAWCGKLWVRRKDVFFSVGQHLTAPALPNVSWRDVELKLAPHVLARLP